MSFEKIHEGMAACFGKAIFVVLLVSISDHFIKNVYEDCFILEENSCFAIF